MHWNWVPSTKRKDLTPRRTFWIFYETVDETFKSLTEGGYGFVRGEAICGPTTSGHDYRISGEIFAGSHHGFGISREAHLPCNVN
ncbi:hypothetical protein CIP100294_02296 [Corynebacterium diphtheriae]|nr:hypothetical protein CIP100294_02296 [Corynebacterium diphtheriae]